MHPIEGLNALGAIWAGAMMRSLVDASMILTVVLLIWFPLRRRISSQMAYGLFLVVLVKAAFPIAIALPATVARMVPGSMTDRLLSPTPIRSLVVESPPLNQRTLTTIRPESPDPDETSRVVDLEDGVRLGTPSQTVAIPAVFPSRQAAPASLAVQPILPSLSTYAGMMLAWIALTTILVARFIWVHARMRLRLRDALALDTATLTVDYNRLRERCGLRLPVPIRVTPWVSSPAVWGLIRPCILVPPGLVEALPPAQLTWVLLHELVHVRRRDPWVALFQRLVQIVYVFHPSVWVANRLIDLQREYACDDAAIVLAGEVSRRDCGAGFLAVIERVCARPGGGSPALGLFGSHTFLRRRLMRILDSRRSMRRRLSLRAALTLGILAVAVLPYVRAREQDQPAPTQPAPAVRTSDGPSAHVPIAEVKTKAPSQTPSPSAREIEVRVVLKENGRPLAGATVEARFYREGYTDRVAATDADGHCRIAVSVADPSFIIVGALKDGFVPLSAAWDQKDVRDGSIPPYTFEMIRGTTIGLQVHDERGKPIAGAKVVPWYTGKIGGSGKESFHLSETFATTTDAEGRWRADVLPAETNPKDKLLFRLIHPDFVSDSNGFSRSLTIDQARAKTDVLVMKVGVPVAGRVVDPAGRPVAGADVALGYSNSDCERTRTDADGRFRFAHVDGGERFNLNLGVEAAGYAPAVKVLRTAADLTSQEVRLEPGKPLHGRVVDTQGKPVAGAVVKLDSFGGTRHWTWKGETDGDGRFGWADGPAAGEVAFNVSKPPFTRAMGRKLAAGSDGTTITLHQPLRLQGTVVDSETGKPIETFLLIPGWGPDRPGSEVSWRRGASEKTLTGGVFDEVGLFPDQGLTRSLRVEAEGYAPGVLVGFKDDAGEIAHDFKLHRASGLSGVLRGPDGKPLTGAVVALTSRTVRTWTLVFNGKFVDFPRVPGVMAETGPDGRYAFWPQDEPSGIMVVANEGFARRSPEQLAASADVRVDPWGRVEGMCHVGTKPVIHQKIRLSVDATTRSSTEYEIYEYQAETDQQGRFIVERVVPGDARATTASRQGTNRGSYASMGSGLIEIKPGETAQVTIGGRGRPMIGRLIVPEGNVLPLDLAIGRGSLSIKSDRTKMPLPADFSTWDPQRRRAYSLAWYTSPEGRASRQAMRGNGLKIESDGSFRAEDVLPGSYELTIDVGGDPPKPGSPVQTMILATAKRDVTVPEIPGGRTDEPLDLGAIELAVDVTHYKALEVGQPAPGFAVKTLDGKPMNLADYRGRYVLLDFWATWCIPCLEQEASLKAAYEAFGKDPRFALVSLSLDEDIEVPKAYLAKHELGWTQGFLGAWSKTSVTADYGVQGIPSIWLIGPDGRVVAKDLQGDAIKAAVLRALESP